MAVDPFANSDAEPPSAPPPAAVAVTRAAGQRHLFAHWDRLDTTARRRLLGQLAAIDWPLVGALTGRVRDGALALPAAESAFDLKTAITPPCRRLHGADRADGRAVGDRGRAVGLFQLHDKGAGAGLTPTQRMDPATNISMLLQRERKALAQVAAEHAAGASPAKLVARFSTLVERPSIPAVREAERVAMLLRLYPTGLPTTTSVGMQVSTPAAASWEPWVRWGLLGTSATLLIMGLARWLAPPARR